MSISKRWRSIGNINLISGADLAKSTVEPDEFIEFVGGRMANRFVKNENDLSKKIANLDTTTDIDGRYRVNEFFCQGNTWKQAMQQLSLHSDMILMDLRSFSDENQGCLYELEQLINHVDLDNVLLIVDDSTDSAFLKNELECIWAEVNVDSPNKKDKMPTLGTFEFHQRYSGSRTQILEKHLITLTS